MLKDIVRPNWDNYPKTVGELAPKDFFNLLRKAIQYECQESSNQEAANWEGAIFNTLAGTLSAPGDQAHPTRDSVYNQETNTAYSADQQVEKEEIPPKP